MRLEREDFTSTAGYKGDTEGVRVGRDAPTHITSHSDPSRGQVTWVQPQQAKVISSILGNPDEIYQFARQETRFHLTRTTSVKATLETYHDFNDVEPLEQVHQGLVVLVDQPKN